MREALYESCETWDIKNNQDRDVRSPNFYDLSAHNLRRIFGELFAFEFDSFKGEHVREDLNEIHEIEHYINIKLDESWQEYLQQHYGPILKKEWEEFVNSHDLRKM